MLIERDRDGRARPAYRSPFPDAHAGMRRTQSWYSRAKRCSYSPMLSSRRRAAGAASSPCPSRRGTRWPRARRGWRMVRVRSRCDTGRPGLGPQPIGGSRSRAPAWNTAPRREAHRIYRPSRAENRHPWRSRRPENAVRSARVDQQQRPDFARQSARECDVVHVPSAWRRHPSEELGSGSDFGGQSS